jgi:hypothetical protein
MLLLLAALTVPMYAQTLPDFFLGNNNAGTNFYMSFLPAWPVPGGVNSIRIYVSSAVDTKVTVEVDAYGYRERKDVPANTVVEFVLPVNIAMPYTKMDRDPSPAEAVYAGKAVHVKARDPIVAYGVTRYQYSSDGFLALPVSALGKEYIIASYADVGDNGTSFGQYLPSEAAVVAPFNNTVVSFTLGGNSVTSTPGGMLPGDTRTFTLDKGDVLMLSSLGQGADLSGSKIVSNKPVSVVSGNFCAYVPLGIAACDHLLEMELPTNVWGKEYVVTKIYGRQKNSFIKIMAKKPNTTVYRDGVPIGVISQAGGVSGTGFLELRVDTGSADNHIISADKPISVTQFNPGQQDDNVISDPFQLVLTPQEQYLDYIVFATPGVSGSGGFTHNYLNLVIQLNNNNRIPPGFEYGVFENDSLVWRRLIDVFGTTFDSIGTINGKAYGVKTLVLPGDGVYHLRSPRKFAAYAYGFSDYDSYAYPAGTSMAEVYNLTGVVDNQAPVPTYSQLGNGKIGGEINDWNVDGSGFLANVFLQGADSHNYTLAIDEYIPGMDNRAKWELTVDNPAEPARAVLSFIDRAGNDTTITFEYDGIGTSVGEYTDGVISLAGFSPNPAPEQSTVHYSLAATGHVRMALYNALGEEVRVLVDETQPQGIKTLNIRTADLPSGMYVCRLTSGNATVSGNLVVVR